MKEIQAIELSTQSGYVKMIIKRYELFGILL